MVGPRRNKEKEFAVEKKNPADLEWVKVEHMSWVKVEHMSWLKVEQIQWQSQDAAVCWSNSTEFFLQWI